MTRKRLLLIGCGLLLRELSDAIVHSPHRIDARFLPAGLHDSGAKGMRPRLQQEIDATDSSCFDAIVLGYGLCGTGIAGLKARSLPLVVPRAHDCITLLMGSRETYTEYFQSNSGVYFRSIGWLERAEQIGDQLSGSGLSQNRDSLVAKYGEEAGQYLYEEAIRYQRSYSKLTYIRIGSELDEPFAELAKEEAREKNWSYEQFAGSLNLFRRLLSGEWDEDFLVVAPGQQIRATHTDEILQADDIADPAPAH